MRLALLTIIATLTPVAAQAKDACVTPADFETMMTAAAPIVVDAAAKSCAALGRPLTTAGALTARWKPEADAAWPAARVAVGHLGGSTFPMELSDEALRPMVRDIVASLLAKDIKADNCGAIDGVLREVAPLTAGGFARMIGSLMMLVNGKSEGFQLCRTDQ